MPIARDWVFGYGSIMNNLSRQASSDKCGGLSETEQSHVLLARIKSEAALVRCWNFRSKTGFTAVGLREKTRDEPGTVICGVLAAVDGAMAEFDERENGYERRALFSEMLNFSRVGPHEPDQTHIVEQMMYALTQPNPPRFWVYVPESAARHAPSEDFPVCQTYVDTVMTGCLYWGGKELAHEWISTTSGWSPYFLNDAPLSRRPWLHREQHAEIDDVLAQHSEWTKFNSRRHSEEFACHWSSGLRGMWGVLPRNSTFVGREKVLRQLEEVFFTQGRKQGKNGVTIVEVTGLGGVGKTQLAVEYCHRQCSSYGTVLWLQAECADSIAAGLRDLAADSGVAVEDMKNDEVVAEMRSRLYRTSSPWFLVFDKVEDRTVIDSFMPRGGFASGHILIISQECIQDGCHIALDCFSQEESVTLLAQTSHQAGRNISEPDVHEKRRELANALGHLPLALAMAAAYMKNFDVSCAEYLRRFRDDSISSMDGQQLTGYSLKQSLGLSLQRITKQEEQQSPVKQSVSAIKLLGCLSLLSPNNITKSLIQCLVRELQRAVTTKENAECASFWRALKHMFQRLPRALSLLVKGGFLIGCAMCRSAFRWRTKVGIVDVFLVAGLLLARASVRSAQSHRISQRGLMPQSKMQPDHLTSLTSLVMSKSPFPPNVEADRLWRLLKRYSLLKVQDDGAGSMHQLLQQFLRRKQSKAEARTAIASCITALKEQWTFDLAETATWPDSARFMEHVKVIGHHLDSFLTVEEELTCACFPKLVGDELSPSVLDMAVEMFLEAALHEAMALSKFEEANQLLNVAMRVHKARTAISSIHRDATPPTNADMSLILRAQGQVAKCRAKYEEASSEAHLGNGAVALHEPGVLRQKELVPEATQQLHQESMQMKQDLSERAISPLKGNVQCFTDESAMLHQLAVADMSQRPSRLDKAKQVLIEAIALGSHRGSFQQLARVQLRRGRPDEAQGRLQAALLQQETYGCVP